ncbi:SIR2 family NAD-dependent protein deacylase [Paenarthrobacter sp. NPDC091669]|uniref:SIR2 family NAD-dependent protein deacylase n=1 Tax=Paenarthrobacter sp. NPDC091669 TaxID=3364384 RepID=UPI0038268BC2
MSTGYLDFVPPPLLDQLVEGQWLPLIGAGFSRNASVQIGEAPPDWKNLGKALAEHLPDFDSTVGPLEIVSAYEHAFGRSTLVDKIARLTRVYDARPGKTHTAFAELGFETVLTTNFDFLLERAYETAGRPCVPLIGESQLAGLSLSTGPKLYKLHGDIHHPENLVMTESDYDLFLNRWPLLATAVTSLFISQTPVLIGYSFDDPDTRQLMALIKERLGGLSRQVWCLQIGASAQEIARFERRGVRVINLPRKQGLSFDEQLRRFFSEIGTYWRRTLLERGQSTDEKVKADLLVPAESSVTCYFEVPLSSVAWYKEAVFPLVEEAGFAPVVASDVQTPPGTETTKGDALAQRARIILVDVSSETGLQYAALAALKRDVRHVLLVKGVGDSVPDILSGLTTLIRNEKNAEAFQKSFREWITKFQDNALESRRSEAERLLEKDDPEGALVSAVALLEAELSRRMDKTKTSSIPRSNPNAWLSTAVEAGLINKSKYGELANAVRARNEIVHGKATVHMKEAARHVSVILKVVRELPSPRSD